jgi:general secretion pathway protein D
MSVSLNPSFGHSNLFFRKRIYQHLAAAIVFVALGGCSVIPPEDLQPPARLVTPVTNTAEQLGGLESETVESDARQRSIRSVPPAQRNVIDVEAAAPGTLFPADEPGDIVLTLNNIPLPAFINEVFGNILEQDFQLSPEVAERKDLVTVRVTQPHNRQSIYELARNILATYGVVISNQGEFLRFVLGRDGELTTEPPLILTGAALPNVPESQRPVILLRSLEVISPADAYGMLRSVFEREQRLKIERDNARNALRLQGPQDLVAAAAGVLASLDQPLMRGGHSLRVEPEFVAPAVLAERLTATLKAQGYDVGSSGSNTVLVPVDALGALFVFAPSRTVLQQVRQWVPELDQAALSVEAGKEGLFWYRVRNTPAAELAATLNATLNGGSGSSARSTETREDQRLQGRTEPSGQATAATSARQGSFVVNEARNMLLFQGEPARWQQLLPLIKELDTAPEQVLIEVVVAEVTLSDEFRFGVEWALDQISAAGAVGQLGSVFGSGAPGSGLDAGGLSWASISGSGNTRIALNAFASNDRVSILQTPRILVRSGEEASVKVGSEVPIITRQSTGDETIEGTSAINQDVQYRSTGVQLRVKPHVFSDGRIDIEIEQEVSEAQPTQSSNINSPTILSRNVNTRLSLEDGSSVLLGGLISTTESKGNSRVPLLGDLPGIGQLFRTDSTSGGRTELMVMIVPYLIRDGQQAEKITEAFRGRLRLLQQQYESRPPLYQGR